MQFQFLYCFNVEQKTLYLLEQVFLNDIQHAFLLAEYESSVTGHNRIHVLSITCVSYSYTTVFKKLPGIQKQTLISNADISKWVQFTADK